MSYRYALIIGNSTYEDPALARLKTPEADVRALAATLRDSAVGGFEEVREVMNEGEAAVRRAISRFFSGKKPDDLLLLYFSGHGVLDPQGRLYLAVRDTERTLLNATAIPASFITEDMDLCRSKRQVLILDCCHSGAFARGVKGKASAVTRTTFEGNGYGRVVLTASDSTQYALEGDQVDEDIALSLFTNHLLEGLNTGEADKSGDGWITVDEWYDYAYDKILSQIPTQTPKKWEYNTQGNLIIARNPRPRPTAAVELPSYLRMAAESEIPRIRLDVLEELERLVKGRNVALAKAAMDQLECMAANDDSFIVRDRAGEILAAEPQEKIQEEKPALAPVDPVSETAGSKEAADRLSAFTKETPDVHGSVQVLRRDDEAEFGAVPVGKTPSSAGTGSERGQPAKSFSDTVTSRVLGLRIGREESFRSVFSTEAGRESGLSWRVWGLALVIGFSWAFGVVLLFFPLFELDLDVRQMLTVTLIAGSIVLSLKVARWDISLIRLVPIFLLWAVVTFLSLSLFLRYLDPPLGALLTQQRNMFLIHRYMPNALYVLHFAGVLFLFVAAFVGTGFVLRSIIVGADGKSIYSRWSLGFLAGVAFQSIFVRADPTGAYAQLELLVTGMLIGTIGGYWMLREVQVHSAVSTGSSGETMPDFLPSWLSDNPFVPAAIAGICWSVGLILLFFYADYYYSDAVFLRYTPILFAGSTAGALVLGSSNILPTKRFFQIFTLWLVGMAIDVYVLQVGLETNASVLIFFSTFLGVFVGTALILRLSIPTLKFIRVVLGWLAGMVLGGVLFVAFAMMDPNGDYIVLWVALAGFAAAAFGVYRTLLEIHRKVPDGTLTRAVL